MRISHRLLVIVLCSLCLFRPSLGFAVERSLDWPIRNVGVVRVTNARGAIEVRGWAQDRIRVVWVTESARPETVKVQVQEVEGRIEVATRYGAGLSVEQKLKENETPIAKANIVVYAPARYPLEILGAAKAEVRVTGWRASAELRALAGTLDLSDVLGKKLSLHCPGCEIKLNQVRVKQLIASGGAGAVLVDRSRATNGFISTTSGTIKVADSTGSYVLSTASGALQANQIRGSLEFLSQDGPVNVEELSGFLSGRSASADIRATIRNWVFQDRAFLESDTGDVTLTLPPTFSGELEAKGGPTHGKPEIGFLLSQMKDREGRITGVVRQGLELLSVQSHEGKVSILRSGS